VATYEAAWSAILGGAANRKRPSSLCVAFVARYNRAVRLWVAPDGSHPRMTSEGEIVRQLGGPLPPAGPRHVTGLQLLELHGANYYVFFSHPAEVTQAMRAFLVVLGERL